jgi:hypothetical protein
VVDMRFPPDLVWLDASRRDNPAERVAGVSERRPSAIRLKLFVEPRARQGDARWRQGYPRVGRNMYLTTYAL